MLTEFYALEKASKDMLLKLAAFGREVAEIRKIDLKNFNLMDYEYWDDPKAIGMDNFGDDLIYPNTQIDLFFEKTQRYENEYEHIIFPLAYLDEDSNWREMEECNAKLRLLAEQKKADEEEDRRRASDLAKLAELQAKYGTLAAQQED